MFLVGPAKSLREIYGVFARAVVETGGAREFWRAREIVLDSKLKRRERLWVYHTLWWLPKITYRGRAPNLVLWKRAAQDLASLRLLKVLIGEISHKRFAPIFSESQIRNMIDFLIFSSKFRQIRRARKNQDRRLELVITIGVAGSGKSTFISKNFPEHTRVSMDEARGKFALDPGDPQQSRLAYLYCLPVLDEVLSAGKSAVWDATALSSSSRKGVLEIARKHNARTTAVFFDLPFDEISRRNRGRRRVVPLRAITEQFRQLEPPHRWEFDKIIIVD